MTHRRLHDQLAAFVRDAARELAALVEAGEELPFEVVDGGGRRGRPLYCYRPLVGAFVDCHRERLRRLDSHARAAAELAGVAGLDGYLEARGEHPVPRGSHERVQRALLALLVAAFGETGDFEPVPERVARACEELERFTVAERHAPASVLTPVLGLAVASAEVPLSDGLTLVRGDELEGVPPEAVWTHSGERPNVLALLDGTPRQALPRLRVLQTALRLFEHGGIALGPVLWTRTAAGPWRLALDAGALSRGRSRGPLVVVPPEQEDELRAFCNLIARRVPALDAASGPGAVAGWALARYEQACERTSARAALSDHLLGLRALLEPEGPASGRLGGRLAALCAESAERAELTARIADAAALEAALIAGTRPAGDGLDELADELAVHLAALLRVAICGRLRTDLCALADELLSAPDGGERHTLALSGA